MMLVRYRIILLLLVLRGLTILQLMRNIMAPFHKHKLDLILNFHRPRKMLEVS